MIISPIRLPLLICIQSAPTANFKLSLLLRTNPCIPFPHANSAAISLGRHCWFPPFFSLVCSQHQSLCPELWDIAFLSCLSTPEGSFYHQKIPLLEGREWFTVSSVGILHLSTELNQFSFGLGQEWRGDVAVNDMVTIMLYSPSTTRKLCPCVESAFVG